MNIKKIIGIVLLSLAFLVITFVFIETYGIKETLFMYGSVVIGSAFLILCICLISSE